MKMQILMKRMRILRVIHEMRGGDFVIPFTSGRAHLYMGGAHIIPLRFATLVRSYAEGGLMQTAQKGFALLTPTRSK